MRTKKRVRNYRKNVAFRGRLHNYSFISKQAIRLSDNAEAMMAKIERFEKMRRDAEIAFRAGQTMPFPG